MIKNEDLFYSLTTKEILNLRLKDLHFNLEQTWLYPHIKKVQSELKRKDIDTNPKYYVGEDWSVYDGNMAISIPFFLLSPKLIKIEREYMGFVDGLGPIQCQKVLRHEVGHLIDNAYKLRQNKQRQILFGNSKTSYPDHYEYNPNSKQFVRYLSEGYAQSHPDEDWAETFATWLDPHSDWKNRYKNWGCLEKLELMNKMMSEIKKQSPFLKNQRSIGGIHRSSQTLKSYWQEKSHRQRKLKRFLDNEIPKEIFKKFEFSFQIKDRGVLIKNIAIQTQLSEFKIKMIIKKIENYYKPRGLLLDHQKLGPYLIEHADDLCKKGLHRILM